MADITNLQTLADDETFYLFEMTFTDTAQTLFRFTAMDNVVYGGNIYTAVPCQITGLTYQKGGVDATPQLVIADKAGVLNSFISSLGGIENSQVTIRRVKKRNLDGGSTPNFNYRQSPEVYVVSAKVAQKGSEITLNLKHKANFSIAHIPGRSINSDCSWKIYRGDGCGYVGTAMYTINNQPTSDSTQDICALTLQACILRGNVDNFSGVPNIDDI